MDVGLWLESLGLGQYRGRFAEQAVDAAVLRDLTEQDLAELGVLIGHRRKLLRAIGELEETSSTRGEPAGNRPFRDAAQASNRVAVHHDGERRLLTVVFCDLVDSTALATRLDPEDTRRIMASYYDCAAEVFARYEGVIVERRGDGLLAYFGYPHAHEDDAEQAIRASLTVVDAIAALELDVPSLPARLQARVGIATGTVVISDLGQGSAREAVGETPNLAARLQAIAEPGKVVICASTRALAGGYFEYQGLGPTLLKGWREPIPAWRILGLSDVESRFEARHKSRDLPLVGRDEEVALLLRRWQNAAEGDGRVVVLSGEPGIGKSHIARALEERLDGETHVTRRYFCSEHRTNSSLFPFIRQTERAARFERGDSPAEKSVKLRKLMADSAADAVEAVELIANLLALPSSDPSGTPNLTPQERKARTLAALLGQITASAARQPVLVIFEDVHWIDPTSLELLTGLVEQAAQLPILLLVTARTDFSPPWPPRAHVTALTVSRLSRRHGATLVTQVAAGKALPDEVREEILSRTDGVPLFVEELTKTILETGLLEERGDRYILNRALPSLAIPTTLHASLTARLDRLGPVKEIAQLGAALGREFSYPILHALAEHPESALQAALEELVQAELVFRRGDASQAVYRFKHALVREAAYAGLLKSRRAELHAAIADTFEQQFPEIAAAQPEIMGHHLGEAGLPRRAIPYWLDAGKKAAARSANLEAVAHLRRGIDAAASLPDTAERARLELDLLMALAPCLIATRGPASSEALTAFTRARHLCERLGEAPEFPRVMFWFATAAVIRGELPQALEATVAVLHDAGARGDRPALINAIRGRAMILLFMGRIVDARDGMQRTLELFETASETERLTARAAGQDAGAAGLAQMSWVLWLLGYVDTAVVRITAALDRARVTRHPHTEAYVCYYAAILHALRSEPSIAFGHATRCLELSREHGFRQWLGLSRSIRGICSSALELSEGPLEQALSALEEYRTAGYQLGITVLYVLLCRALLLHNRPERTLDLIEHGLAIAADNGERIFEAELCRLKACALLAGGFADRGEDARRWLDRALALARSQGARSLELRAARDAAVLCVAGGQRTLAREILGPVCTWFTEGVDADDLQQAKALLQE